MTSSHPIAGGACIGTGVGPTQIDGVIGVAKSYTTRVGAGVFPTELLDSTGDYIRERGHEYGTTTGRPRRCGWLDTVILRYAVRVNGLSCLSLGHLDVFRGLERSISAWPTNGRRTRTCTTCPPICLSAPTVRPVYETLPGWKEDVTEVLTMQDLPANALTFIERVQELAAFPSRRSPSALRGNRP